MSPTNAYHSLFLEHFAWIFVKMPDLASMKYDDLITVQLKQVLEQLSNRSLFRPPAP
jgi:hypothetical protein